MTTLQWITAFLASTVSPLLAWPIAGIVVWAVFSWRIGRVHHVTEEDLLQKEEKWIR